LASRTRLSLGSAWYKALERGTIQAPTALQNRGRKKRYDWAAVQRYYDEGHTYQECRRHFGFAAETWRLAARRGEIHARGQQWPLQKLLREGRSSKSISNG
jgi:hypothetical protein